MYNNGREVADFQGDRQADKMARFAMSNISSNNRVVKIKQNHNQVIKLPVHHHKKPYHLHPELELDPNNLITLCMENLCHIDIGHGDSFKAYNPNVAEDASTVLANKEQLKRILAEVSVKAKQQRLFE
jgi:hypothetical protein